MNWARLVPTVLAVLLFIHSAGCKSNPTLDEMVSLSKSKMVDDRREALSHFRSLKDKATVPKLLKLLSDKNDWTRLCAVRGLGSIGDRSCLDTLASLLHDKREEIRLCTVVALALLQDKRAITPFFELMKANTKHPRPSGVFFMDLQPEDALWRFSLGPDFEFGPMLEALTGEAHGDDHKAWLQWYETEWKPAQEKKGGK
jgi:hypothetical protein